MVDGGGNLNLETHVACVERSFVWMELLNDYDSDIPDSLSCYLQIKDGLTFKKVLEVKKSGIEGVGLGMIVPVYTGVS